MFYEEIAEAMRRKRLDAEAGAGGGAGGGGGAGAGAGASGGASSGGDGGSADGGAGDSSSATPSSDSPSSESPTSYRGGFFVGYGAGTFNPKSKKKKKKKKLQLDKKGIYENIEALEKREDQLSYALGKAREITRDIKRDDTHIEILSRLGTMAEEVGLELDKYQESKVLEVHNQLESEVYELEEVFIDALRDVRNQIEELQYDDD